MPLPGDCVISRGTSHVDNAVAQIKLKGVRWQGIVRDRQMRAERPAYQAINREHPLVPRALQGKRERLDLLMSRVAQRVCIWRRSPAGIRQVRYDRGRPRRTHRVSKAGPKGTKRSAALEHGLPLFIECGHPLAAVLRRNHAVIGLDLEQHPVGKAERQTVMHGPLCLPD
jgi:hypothetical protein